ncbi:MAG: DNA repair protein RadC [Myxococcota bacterium]
MAPSEPDRPRERMHSLGARSLSNAELVALVLRSGARGRDALSIAQEVLRAVDGVDGLARASAAALARLDGLGPATAGSLSAAIELGRRVASRPVQAGHVLRGPEDVHLHFAPRLRDAARERFLVLLLDGRHRVLGDATVSVGTLTASLVHPREVFRPALARAAAAVVLVHNHPSGDPTPSAEDRRVTSRLAEAGELLGVRVVDHVVVAERGYFSFQQAGELGGDV